MTRGRLRMAPGRLRMAEVPQTSRLRMARSHLRMAMAFYGWPGFSLQAVHGWRESPIGSRAAMYHYTSRWQRGPLLPGRRAGADPWQIPGRASFTGHSRDSTVCRSWRNRWDSRNPDSSWHSDLREFECCTCPLGQPWRAIVEVVEIRAHPDVRHGTRLGVSSCLLWSRYNPLSAVTYADAPLVVEYVTPAPTVVTLLLLPQEQRRQQSSRQRQC